MNGEAVWTPPTDRLMTPREARLAAVLADPHAVLSSPVTITATDVSFSLEEAYMLSGPAVAAWRAKAEELEKAQGWAKVQALAEQTARDIAARTRACEICTYVRLTETVDVDGVPLALCAECRQAVEARD